MVILAADPGSDSGAAVLVDGSVRRWWCWLGYAPTKAYPLGRLEVLRSDGERLALVGPAELGRYIWRSVALYDPSARCCVEGQFIQKGIPQRDILSLARWSGAFEAAFPYPVLAPTYTTWAPTIGIQGVAGPAANRKAMEWARRQPWDVDPWGRLGDTQRAVDMSVALAEARGMAEWVATR